MAKIDSKDYTLRHGKMNKSDDTVYRVRNGKQHSYTFHPSEEPASKAQTEHRKLFGKVNAVVNVIMADKEQVAEWTKRMEECNASIKPFLPPYPQRFKTVRKYIFSVIRQQYENQPSVRRRRKNVPVTLPKGVKLVVKTFGELTPAELYEMLKARFNVFYLEQDCHYPDMDDIDYAATHLALIRRGKVIAYARLFKAAKTNRWTVGRMLSTVRGKGFGKYIMLQVEAEAKRLGAASLFMHAQTQAVAFYEQLGYQTFGEVFQEADIPHISMKKEIL